MKQILSISSQILSVIGYQEYDKDKTYVNSRYVVDLAIDGGVLKYNTLTYEMIFLDSEEIDGGIQDAYLAKRWFLIPDEVSQYEVCMTFKQIFRNMYKRKKFGKLSSYTVMTTTNCNARCAYCYEAGCVKQDMTEKTAQAVCKYITRTSDGKCNIQWFGGEPLYNKEMINTICKGLKESGVFFTSSIITNGYLLDTCTSEELKLWNLRKAQITIDGMEDTYNEVKNYIYEDENAFSKVIGNIKYLLEDDITVAIRLNISQDNAEELHDLVDFLCDEFSGYEKFSVYSHPLYDDCGMTPVSDGSTDDYISIQEHIESKGIGQTYPLDSMRILNNCMADNKLSVVISPAGKLSLCEHYSDTELIGDVYHDTFKSSVVKEWEKPYSIPECKECQLYAQCTKLKKCPIAECNDSWKEHVLYEIKSAMRKAYESHEEENG